MAALGFLIFFFAYLIGAWWCPTTAVTTPLTTMTQLSRESRPLQLIKQVPVTLDIWLE
jgi:hypothetical protein